MSELKIIFGRGEAVVQRIDQGHDPQLNWDQTLEVVQHPTDGLRRTELVEIIAYLGAQLVGARNSVDREADLAMSRISTIVAEHDRRHRKKLGGVA